MLSTATGIALALSAAPALAQSGERTQVELRAQPLDETLGAIGNVFGVTVVAPDALVGGRTAPSVSGSLTAEQAIARALRGSGLAYRRSRNGGFVVERGAAARKVGQGGGAHVEQTGTDSAAAPRDAIIVIGEKIPREVAETYTSVDVITGDELDDHAVNTIGEALNRSANVRSFETGEGNSSFVIRGLNAEGVTQPSSSSPVISVVVDGAPQGIETTRRGSRGVWDIEQIEVLRGPQSTLQGRDALGGAVVVKTKDPTWEPELLAEGIAGSKALRSGAIALSAPIIEDQLAFRIAGQVFSQENDIDYAQPALAKLGQERFEEVRGKLLFKPGALPGFTALFTVSYTHDKPAYGLVGTPDFFAREYDDTNQGAEFRDTKVSRYIAELSYEISPAWTVKSVTSFVDTHVEIDTPEGYTSFRDDERDYGDFAQDLQLTYDDPDAPFSGVFGLYGGRYKGRLLSDYKTTALAPYGVSEAYIQKLDSRPLTKSIAAYADLRYDIGDRFTLIAGGRLLHDVVSSDVSGFVINVDETLVAIFSGCTLVDPDTCPVYSPLTSDLTAKKTAFLPKAGFAFHPAETQTLAATVNRGYRAGFSERATGSTEFNTVQPEFLWTYEVAYRSEWLDGRLVANANAFYNDYRNQQIPVFFDEIAYPGQTITINAAESHSYGAELDLRWRSLPQLDLFASAGLLKTEFDRGTAIVGGDEIDLAGKEFPEAPTLTASVGGIWTHKSGFFLGGDASYTDGFYSKSALDNAAGQHLDGFVLVNMQAGIELDRFKLTVFSKNLFDKQYLTAINSSLSRAAVGRERSFGIQANVHF